MIQLSDIHFLLKNTCGYISISARITVCLLLSECKILAKFQDGSAHDFVDDSVKFKIFFEIYDDVNEKGSFSLSSFY